MSVIANPTLTGNEVNLERLQVGTGHYRAPYTRKNLLDNWYFVGGGDQQGAGQFPVNQRKQTSYSGAIYGIDRWKNKGAGTVTISSSGIVVSGSSSASAFWGQEIENPVPDGTVCTFSALSSDGTLYKATSAMSSASQWNCAFSHANGVGRVEYSTYALLTASAGKTATWVAVKLELGSEQTLAHLENGVWVLNEIPDYTTQLLRCQRFFRVFTSTSASTTGYGYSTNPKNLRPEMRATPSTGSFTYGGTTYYYLDTNL